MDFFYTPLKPCLKSECARGKNVKFIHIRNVGNPCLPILFPAKGNGTSLICKVSAAVILPGERVNIFDFTMGYQHNLFLAQSKI